MEKKTVNIAVDGPSGAGKSTLAKLIAEKYGYIYVDTGALYRSIGLYVLNKNIEPSDAEGVIACLPEISIDIKYESGEQHVYLCGDDVSGLIRTPEVSMAASAVSAIPDVRAFLLDMQRGIARTHNCVLDGRDIGTVILPNADVKIFLSATPEQRAERRLKELAEKGIESTFEEVLRDIEKRDKDDSTRAAAPLKPAEDSVPLDNSKLDRQQTLDAASAIIDAKLAEKA